MQADLPFYDSPEDAVRSAIQAAGGAKTIGSILWPDKGPALERIQNGNVTKLERRA